MVPSIFKVSKFPLLAGEKALVLKDLCGYQVHPENFPILTLIWNYNYSTKSLQSNTLKLVFDCITEKIHVYLRALESYEGYLGIMPTITFLKQLKKNKQDKLYEIVVFTSLDIR